MITPFRLFLTGTWLALVSATSAATIQINFGTGVSITGWNNITTAVGATSSGSLLNMVDSSGAITTTDFTMNARFNGVNTNGASTGGTTNSFGIPNQVAASSLYGNTVAFGGITAANPTFTLSSLDQGYHYSFAVYASRVTVSDNRSGFYTATGLNTVSGTVNASGNTSFILSLDNVRPDASGNIIFDIETPVQNDNTNGFTYLNALTFTATAIPEPATGTTVFVAAALLLTATRRRLRSK